MSEAPTPSEEGAALRPGPGRGAGSAGAGRCWAARRAHRCGRRSGSAPGWSDAVDVALVAVGGYGRREPAAGSDLDLVLLHRDGVGVRPLTDALWYPVWDSGVGLDHAVRTVRQAITVAGEDLKAALGLLDARHVAGDAALTEELRREGGSRVGGATPRRRLPELMEAVRTRAERFGGGSPSASNRTSARRPAAGSATSMRSTRSRRPGSATPPIRGCVRPTAGCWTSGMAKPAPSLRARGSDRPGGAGPDGGRGGIGRRGRRRA